MIMQTLPIIQQVRCTNQYLLKELIIIRNSYRKYFVPRVDITSYNVLIDGRNFYDQPINNSIRRYDEIRKIATGKGDNYATGCLLDYDYFKKNYQLIAVDLSKQRELDVDPRAIQ